MAAVITVLLAAPINSNTVRVFMSEQPRHISPHGPGDALNRVNWALSVVGTPPPRVTAPVVSMVENAQAQPTAISGQPNAWSVDLRTDRRLSIRATYRATANAAIESQSGVNTINPAANTDDFPGIIELRPRAQRQPRVVRQGTDLAYDTFAGTYVLSGAGDVATHSGTEYLKKRIIRRLLTAPGGFYHLDDYGAGLTVKGKLNTTAIADLRARILRQVKAEEDVATAAVDVQAVAGVLYVHVDVRPRASEAFTLAFEVPGEGPALVAA